MKILKQLALTALICSGHSLMAIPSLKKLKKVDKTITEKIKATYRTMSEQELEKALKQIEAGHHPKLTEKLQTQLQILRAEKKLVTESKEATDAQKKVEKEAEDRRKAVEELQQAEEKLKKLEELEESEEIKKEETIGEPPAEKIEIEKEEIKQEDIKQIAKPEPTPKQEPAPQLPAEPCTAGVCPKPEPAKKTEEIVLLETLDEVDRINRFDPRYRASINAIFAKQQADFEKSPQEHFEAVKENLVKLMQMGEFGLERPIRYKFADIVKEKMLAGGLDKDEMDQLNKIHSELNK